MEKESLDGTLSMGPFSSWSLFVPSAVGSRRCCSGHNKEQHKATTALEVFPQPRARGGKGLSGGALGPPAYILHANGSRDFNCTSRREEKGSSGWLPEEPCSQHSSLHLWDAKTTAHKKSSWKSFERPEENKWGELETGTPGHNSFFLHAWEQMIFRTTLLPACQMLGNWTTELFYIHTYLHPSYVWSKKKNTKKIL